MGLLLSVMVLFFLFTDAVPVDPAEQEDTTIGSLLRLIENVVGDELRPWAKPVTRVDMDRIEDLVEMGFLSFHEALWYVEKENVLE